MKNNRTMQEMNEQYKDCPIHVNEYEVDGRRYRVHSHFIGERDINDVMYRYAEDRAMSEMLSLVPKTAYSNSDIDKSIKI